MNDSDLIEDDMTNGWNSQVTVSKGETFEVGIGCGQPLGIISGPCVIESRDHLLKEAERVVSIVRQHGFGIIFKSSYDKANRTSKSSFRGVGLDEGLRILEDVRELFQVAIITDAHTEAEVRAASQVVDVIQIPAFLCRQTDLLLAAGGTGLPVLIKKGQFLPPEDMVHVSRKVTMGGSKDILICERGSCFGYRELIVDFRSLQKFREYGFPVVFDATHSVQVMGGLQGKSGGDRKYVAALARAAVAVGTDALFLEAHSDPDNAPSDGPNMLSHDQLNVLLRDLKALNEVELLTR